MSGYLAVSQGGGAADGVPRITAMLCLCSMSTERRQPGKIKLALRRLHQRPGKFGDAHVGEAEIGHHARVFFPKRFRRLVGIVVNPEQKRPSGGSAGKTRDRLGPQGKPDTGRAHQGKSAAEKLTPGRRCQSQDLCLCCSTRTFSTQLKGLSRKSRCVWHVVWRGRLVRVSRKSLCAGRNAGDRHVHADAPLSTRARAPAPHISTASGRTIFRMLVPPEIKGQKYIDLASLRKDGSAVHTPVWFGEKDDKLYVMTRSDSGKYKRIRNNPQVRIAPAPFAEKSPARSSRPNARILPPEDWPGPAKPSSANTGSRAFPSSGASRTSIWKSKSRLNHGLLCVLCGNFATFAVKIFERTSP